jgi:hypothetical protein
MARCAATGAALAFPSNTPTPTKPCGAHPGNDEWRCARGQVCGTPQLGHQRNSGLPVSLGRRLGRAPLQRLAICKPTRIEAKPPTPPYSFAANPIGEKPSWSSGRFGVALCRATKCRLRKSEDSSGLAKAIRTARKGFSHCDPLRALRAAAPKKGASEAAPRGRGTTRAARRYGPLPHGLIGKRTRLARRSVRSRFHPPAARVVRLLVRTLRSVNVAWCSENRRGQLGRRRRRRLRRQSAPFAPALAEGCVAPGSGIVLAGRGFGRAAHAQ